MADENQKITEHRGKITYSKCKMTEYHSDGELGVAACGIGWVGQCRFGAPINAG
jgi:hypothetical protein